MFRPSLLAIFMELLIFLIYKTYASTYKVGILHVIVIIIIIIIIIIMKTKYHNS